MYCEHCGTKIDKSHKFCTKCGNPTTGELKTNPVIQHVSIDRWWQRLFKVAYIFLCLQILWIVPLVWSSNAESCYYNDCYGSSTQSFWYSVLAIGIFVVITRLIKISGLYVALGQKPEWEKEFKKLY